jgi:hypothetical protein
MLTAKTNLSSALRIPVVPASALGVVLGLAGLGGAWRAAHQVWAYPEAVPYLRLVPDPSA